MHGKEEGPIVPPGSVCPLPSLWGLAVITQTHTKTLPKISNVEGTGGVFVCAKPTQITLRKIMIFKTLSTIGDGDQGGAEA